MPKVRRFFKDLALKLFGPTRKQIVKKLVAGVSGLEIVRSECRHLAPIVGVYGAIKIEGNALPIFTYLVFDKELMEFVTVKAIVSLPDKITFEFRTDDLGEVVGKRAYTAPFYRLARHLFNYFPLPMPTKPKDQLGDVIHAG